VLAGARNPSAMRRTKTSSDGELLLLWVGKNILYARNIPI